MIPPTHTHTHARTHTHCTYLYAHVNTLLRSYMSIKDGVFKLWDIRNFQCVQSFMPSEANERATKKAQVHLNCFFHSKLPSRNALQKEHDARIFSASKKLFCFDQTRVVHEATTDLTGVFWIAWNEESSIFLTASV
jgi:hypothetical protein